ncbi:MAG: hypothetical protein ABSC48_02420 [Terracidiphilus sp.]|jgi:hypothetical protein
MIVQKPHVRFPPAGAPIGREFDKLMLSIVVGTEPVSSRSLGAHVVRERIKRLPGVWAA